MVLWHFDGRFPVNQNHYQAHVHTGMFLGRLIENNLVSNEFKNNYVEELKKCKQQILTGANIY